MKSINFLITLIPILFLTIACEKKVVENDFLPGLEIDFELLFVYENKQEMLTAAKDMFPDLLEEAKVLINKKENVSHVLFSFRIADGKAKLKELLIYDTLRHTVNDYHNYTKKLGAIHGLSANEELLNMAFNAKAPENYVEIEQLKFTNNREEQTQIFINYLNCNYQSISDTLDLIVVLSPNNLRAYAN
jgi:hypothetical protein